MGSLFAPAVLLVLAGVLGGFLVHNRYPARLFLGDAGSDFLGFLLGAMTVAGTYYRYGEGDSRYSVLSPLLVMAVPLYESASVFLIWLGERHDPFTRNRHHFSYRLHGEWAHARRPSGRSCCLGLASGRSRSPGSTRWGRSWWWVNRPA